MEGFEKFDIKDPEDIKYLIPSGFLEEVESMEDLWNLDEFDLMARVVAAEAELAQRCCCEFLTTDGIGSI